MKIRQIMIASLLLFSGTKALAQPERVSVWDGFGDNVYMDAGVGVQALFAPGWQDIAFGKQITPALNLGVGKWITPFWGLHLDVFGYSQNGYRGTPLDKGVEPFSPLNRVDVGYDGSFRYYLRYLGVRADFRLSLLNLITGCEREGALYDLVPFAGMGYKHAFAYRGTTRENLFTGHVGVRNRFSVHRLLDVNVDVVSEWTDNYVNPTKGRYMASVALSAGVSVYLGRRAFRKLMITVPVEAVRYRVDTVLVREVEVLGKDRVIGRVNADRSKWNVVMASIRFSVNRNKPNEGQETQLYEVARFLHDNPGAAVCVEGYADATSGSEAYNRELAGQRAEYVKKQLVDKYGVRSSQVTTKTVGTDVQPYKGEPVWNCVALIRLVK